MSADQTLIVKILELDMGFTVDKIKAALLATNNSTERAIDWLFENQNAAPSPAIPVQQPQPVHSAPDSEFQKLKSLIISMGVPSPSERILRNALRQKEEDPVTWVLQKISAEAAKPDHGDVKREEEDVESRKQKLMRLAEERRKNQEREAIERKKYNEKMLLQEKKEEKTKVEQSAEIKARVLKLKKEREMKLKAEASKRKEKALKDHIRREALANKEREEELERERARRRLEERIKTPDECLDMITRRYGEESSRHTMLFISKIFRKIVENPRNEKYRNLSKSKTVVQDELVIRLGGSLFLKLFGWVETKEGFEFRKNNTEELEKAVRQIELRFRKKTNIPKLVGSMITSPEATWIGLSLIRKYLDNFRRSPSEMTNKLNIEDADFKQWVGKNPQAIKILKSLGWTLIKKGEKKFFYLAKPDDGLFVQALKDINIEMRKLASTRLRETRIFQEVFSIQKINGEAITNKLKGFILKFLGKITDEPLNIRIQRISIDKIEHKIRGITPLLMAFGFEKKGSILALSIDVAVLGHKLRMFDESFGFVFGQRTKTRGKYI